MKIVYFGTPYVARDTFALLLKHGITPALVVTNPDAAQGRGQKLEASVTKQWAQEHALPILTPEKLDAQSIETIKSYGCELAIVVAYGKILPQTLIEAFQYGVLNVHYSLLPKYRGASPVEAALLHGDTTTGVTIQKMVYQLDAGDIIAIQETPIEPQETTIELRTRLIELGAVLLADILVPYTNGEITPTPQDQTRATHSGKIRKEEGELDLEANQVLNWNKYRAYAQSPGTYFFSVRNGKQIRVKITKATFQDNRFTILRVIPEGKKEMDFVVFTKSL